VLETGGEFVGVDRAARPQRVVGSGRPRQLNDRSQDQEWIDYPSAVPVAGLRISVSDPMLLDVELAVVEVTKPHVLETYCSSIPHICSCSAVSSLPSAVTSPKPSVEGTSADMVVGAGTSVVAGAGCVGVEAAVPSSSTQLARLISATATNADIAHADRMSILPSRSTPIVRFGDDCGPGANVSIYR
jgi:hypothetical protein